MAEIEGSKEGFREELQVWFWLLAVRGVEVLGGRGDDSERDRKALRKMDQEGGGISVTRWLTEGG